MEEEEKEEEEEEEKEEEEEEKEEEQEEKEEEAKFPTSGMAAAPSWILRRLSCGSCPQS